MMGVGIGSTFILFSPLLGMIIWLAFLALGLFVAYLIIRTAINHSRLNQHMEELRFELSQISHQVRELRDMIDRNKWQS
jgi:hypothetical protein